jgi:lipopolysaccharide export system permease protein
MIRLLDRYVARQFMGTFLALVLGLPWLFVVIDITDNVDSYLARGLPREAVALSYLYYLPQFVFWSIPIAGLVATVMTVGNMTRHQEIAAAKAGGVSFYRLITPILLLSAAMSVGAVAIGEMVPGTQIKRLELLGERTANESTLRTNFVFQSEDGQMISVRRLDTYSAEMHGVVIEREVAPGSPGVHVSAALAGWTPEEGWMMREGYLRVLPDDTVEHTIAYDSLRLATLRETPEDLLAEPKKTDEMRYEEIGRFIASVERAGGDTRRMRVEQAQKISLPLALFVIVLFGAPLATSSRRGGAAYGVGLSLGVTLIYLMLFRVATAVGSSGTLDPLVAAWLPNALFLMAGIYLLIRVRT